MYSVNAPEFSRNYGFWNEAEQDAIMNSHVAIGGVGGDGFELGQRLAHMGVANFSVADPEVFEPENINRVPAANVETVGLKKAHVFREEILKINPEAHVRIFDEGINAGNVADFVSKATIAYDETELTHPELGTMLARAARERGIPNVLVMNIGFAAQVTSFDPNSKHTFERMMGFADDMPLDEVAKQPLNLSRCVPYIPHYVDLDTLKAVNEGASLPSIVQGVGVASAIGASQGFLHIVSGVEGSKRPQPLWAPKMAYVDSLTMEAGKTSHPRISHYRHLGVMIGRNMMGLNEKASYTAEDRKVRTDAHLAELASIQNTK